MAVFFIVDSTTNRVKRWGSGAAGCAGVPGTGETEVSQDDLPPVPGANEHLHWNGTAVVVDPETLDECKARLIASVKGWRNAKVEAVLDIEHPNASGKKFAVGFTHQHNWHALHTIRNDTSRISYPYTVRTKDEGDYHDIADAAEVDTMFGLVVDTVKTEIDACRTAIGNIVGATDGPGAQAAHDAYYGT